MFGFNSGPEHDLDERKTLDQAFTRIISHKGLLCKTIISCIYWGENKQTNPVCGSYRAGGGLERPRWAADAVAVIAVVWREAGGAGGEGGGHGQGAAWSGRLGHAAAVVVHVAVLKLLKWHQRRFSLEKYFTLFILRAAAAAHHCILHLKHNVH